MASKLPDETPAPPKLACWTELVESVELPWDVIPALSAGRPGLLVPRAMSAVEVGMLMNLIRVMMDTNQELQRHSRQVAELVTHAIQLMKGAQLKMANVEHVANFRTADDEEDTE